MQLAEPVSLSPVEQSEPIPVAPQEIPPPALPAPEPDVVAKTQDAIPGQPVVRYNPKVVRDDSLIQYRDAEQLEEITPEIMTVRTARPPVAVSAPPVAVERFGDPGDVNPTVDAVVADPIANLDRSFAESNVMDVVTQPDQAPVLATPPAPKLTPVERSLGDLDEVDRPTAEPSTVSVARPEPGRFIEDDGAPAPTVAGPVEFNHAQATQDTVTRPAVQTVTPTTAPDRPVTTDVAAPSEVTLNLTRAQVRSMTIGGRLRRVSISNKDVCQAFAASSNQIKLIGTGLGRTTLTIWADVETGEPTRVQTFLIEVAEAVDAKGDKVSENTRLLNDSIAKAFPGANVVVQRNGGQLTVRGNCGDEQTAKQIIRMVRKSCLVPVTDQLQIR